MFGGRVGPLETIVILVLLLLIFGPSKLPELGKALGRGIREFRTASHELTKSISEEEGSS